MKNKFNLRRGLALSGLMAVLTASPAGAALYGLSFFSNELFTVNPATGAASGVAVLSENVNGYGLAASGNFLYTFNPNKDVVQEINPFTGVITRDIAIGIGDRIGEGDIAFGAGGTGFITSALNADFSLDNGLYSFNILTGTSSRIGTSSVTFDALALMGATLYGIDSDAAPSLYSINQATAEATRIGSLGFGGGSPFAALSAGPGGLLYAALDDRLFTVNPLTGAASIVDPSVEEIGFSGVSGLTNSAVPEPSATLLGLLSFGLLARRRRSVG